MNPRWWELAFALLATAFVLSLSRLPYPGDFLLKVAPIVCLLVAVRLARRDHYGRLIALALVFSGTGDVSLELGHFTLGLAAFLVGHLFYLAALAQRPVLSPARLLGVGAVIALSTAMLFYLAPHLGDMRTPVFLYMGVITAMAVAAIAGAGNHWLVGLGALLFLLSDALIAANRFVEPVPGARYWIMVLYYGAQFLLTRDARAGQGIAPGG